MAYKIVRNAGCLPPEVEERKEISRLEELLAGLQDEAERMRAQKRLVVLRMKVDMGRPRPLPFTSAGDTRNVLSNAWPGRGEGDPMRNSGSLSWQELRQIDDPRDLDWSSVPKTLIERHANPWQDIDEAAGCITRELEAQVGIKPSDKR